MYTSSTNPFKIIKQSVIASFILILSLICLTGCGLSPAELETVDYTPLPGDDLEVSTPEEQGLDSDLVADFIASLTEE